MLQKRKWRVFDLFTIRKWLPEVEVEKLLVYYAICFSYFTMKSAIVVVRPLLFRSLGFSLSSVGFLVGLSYASGVLVRFLVGTHSDFAGRKVYVVSSLLLSGFVALGYSGRYLPIFPVLVLLEGAGNGMFLAVRSPLLRSLSSPHNRGKVFGAMVSIGSIAGTVGNTVGGFLFMIFTSPSLLFQIYGVLFLLTALLITFCVPTSYLNKTTAEKKSQKNKIQKVKLIRDVHPSLVLMCAVTTLQGMIIFPLWGLIIPLHITETLLLSSAVVGVVLGLDSFFSIGSSVIGGHLADKRHAGSLFVMISFLMAFLTLFLFFFREIPSLALGLVVILGVILSSTQPILEKIEANYVRERNSGFDYALLRSFTGLGAVSGNFLAGIIMEKFGGSNYFLFTCLAFIVAGGLVLKIQKTNDTTEIAGL